jgi:hypothetical protein
LLGNIFLSILQLGSKEVLPIWRAKCSKRIFYGPMNKVHWKKRKSYEHTHELINMNQILTKKILIEIQFSCTQFCRPTKRYARHYLFTTKRHVPIQIWKNALTLFIPFQKVCANPNITSSPPRGMHPFGFESIWCSPYIVYIISSCLLFLIIFSTFYIHDHSCYF